MKHKFIVVINILGLSLFLGVYSVYAEVKNEEVNKGASPQKVGQALYGPGKSQDAAGNSPEYSFTELLIKLKPQAQKMLKASLRPDDTGLSSLNALNKEMKVTKFERIAKLTQNTKLREHELFRWYEVALPEETLLGASSQGALALGNNQPNLIETKKTELKIIMDKYKKDPNVELVEYNYIVHTLNEPNDPYYSSSGSWGQSFPDLWGLKKIKSAQAWDKTTGSSSIIVADIDTGVDRTHPDIAANMWVNTREIRDNGIDDDGNGYIDDYYGWDFFNNDNDPMDDHGHGTHTAGTIAAVGNNSIGVVGVNWNAKIMALKFMGPGDSGGTLENAVKALEYAANMGARVSSNSWGGGGQSQIVDDVVKYEHDKGMVVVAAAGNSDMDALYFSPASSDYAITVAASDVTDLKAWFSNWGEKIDVAAPGVDILSLRAQGTDIYGNGKHFVPPDDVNAKYYRASGTSMAAPHVSGLAALLLSKNPNLTNEEVRQIIRAGADDLGDAGKDKYFGYGRINANGSMNLIDTHPLTPVITSPVGRTIASDSNTAVQIKGSIGGPNFASYKVELGAGRAPTSWTLITTSVVQPTTNTTLANLDMSKFDDGWYIIRLTAIDTEGKSYQFQVNDITVDNLDAVISFPRILVSLGSMDIAGTAITKNDIPFANYTIEWGTGDSPTTWSTTGISLINNGLQAVSSGKLATWDTSALADGQTYALRLTVNNLNGGKQQTTATLKADKDLVPGWPKFITVPIVSVVVVPTLADLDGDGNKELIYALVYKDGRVDACAYRKDGNSLLGFPVTVGNGTGSQPVNIDDLDNDGKKEIVTTVIASDGLGGVQNSFNIIKSNGTFCPGWPKTIITTDIGSMRPTIADIDGDGKKDIIFMQIATGNVATLYAYHLNGTLLSGFPKTFSSDNPLRFMPSGLSVFDLDKDGKPEISWAFGNRIYLFDNAGNLLPGWPYIVPPHNSNIGGTNRDYLMLFDGLLTAGDVYGNGQQEVFALSTGALDDAGGLHGQSGPTVMYGFTKDGTVLPGWPKTDATDNFTNSAYTFQTSGPLFTDLDADGKDEIIVSGYPYPCAIFGVEGNKNPTFSQSTNPTTQFALSDVDGDGQAELAWGGSDQAMFILKRNAADYSVYWHGRAMTDGTFFYVFYNPPVIADMDNDGQMEMATIGNEYQKFNERLSAITNNIAICLWKIPKPSATPPAKYDWPMLGHDSARTGRLPLVEPPADTTPPTTPVVTDEGRFVGLTDHLYASWVSSDPESGISEYQYRIIQDSISHLDIKDSRVVIRDWTSTDTFNSVTAGSLGLTANKVYYFEVKAKNGKGLWSEVGCSDGIIIDTLPPSVEIMSPRNKAVVSGVVRVLVKASDNTGVTKVELYVDGSLSVVSSSLRGYFCNLPWDTTKLKNGSHALTVKAYDGAGNIGTSYPIKVNVSNNGEDPGGTRNINKKVGNARRLNNR